MLKEDILRNNVKQLQEQLQDCYKRIDHLKDVENSANELLNLYKKADGSYRWSISNKTYKEVEALKKLNRTLRKGGH